MARLNQVPEPVRTAVAEVDCASFADTPYVSGPPLNQRRIAMISTAGLMRRGDTPFRGGDYHYHPISHRIDGGGILMSHISVNFDRTGFQQDHNVVLPTERLNELLAESAIGSIALDHYSFMGATDPVLMEEGARKLAAILRENSVDGVALLPV